MFRLLLIMCLFAFSLSSFGQEGEVKRSSDVVVIKGKSYYLHVVEQGQTLFSICKAYGVDLEEVKQLNQKSDNTLSIFDVLKIPYSEPYVEQDKNYYYYKVQKGETLYAISRKFDIKIKKILKDNPGYERTPLGIGDIVKLSLKEITMPHEPTEQKVTGKPEGQVQLKAQPEDAENRALTDTIRMPLFVSEQNEDEDTSFYFDVNAAVPDNKYVKIALLLPFFARENMASENDGTDSLSKKRLNRQVLHKSEQFVYFYEGFLLALDSLKKEGYKIELYPFDTEKNSEKVLAITEKINELNPDLIVGPVYGSELRMIATNLTNRSIPLVYPLSSRGEDFTQYPNFLQVNPSFQVLAREMAEWLRLQENINPIVLNPVQGEIMDEWSLNEASEKKTFTDQLHQLPDINFYKWNFQEDQLEAFKQCLDLYQENVIILPTVKEADISKILPVLSALTEGYRITVVGLPDWQNFTSVDHETFYKLNVKLFSYSYIDPSREETRNFAETYRRYFYTEPHTLTNKAYDMALYFVPLVAKYGDRSLEAIRYYNKNGLFSRFYFTKVCAACGMENRGVFIVNYGSDYQLHIEPFKY